MNFTKLNITACIAVLALSACEPRPVEEWDGLNGKWVVLADCPGTSSIGQHRLRGRASINETGPDTYAGTFADEAGNQGKFTAKEANGVYEANLELLNGHVITTLLTYNQEANTLAGVSSEGCDVTARRPYY